MVGRIYLYIKQIMVVPIVIKLHFSSQYQLLFSFFSNFLLYKILNQRKEF